MNSPTKKVLLQKLEIYLKPLKIKSGFEKQKHPDNYWLILVIATLSNGKDENFAADCMLNQNIFGSQKNAEIDPCS